jgi:membrane-bound ClpP family serine protease
VAAAIWLVVMAATGQSGSLLWTLFGADMAISGGLATIAWRGLKVQGDQIPGASSVNIVGAEGVAVSDLVPGGVVRVRGENWSATSLNGNVPAGSRIQVIEAGVRLGVWSDDAVPAETEEQPHSLLAAHWHHRSADAEKKGEQ